MNEIIAIDIGNTSAAFGYFKGEKLLRVRSLLTTKLGSQGIGFLKKNFPIKNISAVVIAGVVPDKTSRLRREIPAKLKIKTWQIGRDIQVLIKNKYRDPKQVGIDRLVNAFAFYKKHKRAGIVVDFGTAITLDIVSANGEYLGGIIAPGIEISLDALYRRTALLPKIKLAHPAGIVGKDTIESIRIGCSYGIGGLCDRLIDEITRRLETKPFVLATGGYAGFISRYSRKMDAIDPHLTLHGIFSVFKYFS